MTLRITGALTAASVFVLDRITKVIIEQRVSVWDSIPVIPGFFDIVHTKNRGAAFGMFSDATGPLRPFLLIGVSAGVLIFIAMLLFKPQRHGLAGTPLSLIGLSLILGGALGNLYDRIVHSMVTDFLEFYYGQYRFAAFNVADSAITVGAALLLIDLWRSGKKSDVSQAH